MELVYYSEGQVAQTAHVMPGVYIGPSVLIEDNALIGPNAAILGEDEGDNTAAIIRAGATVGANATILSGVIIGFRARVAPGAVVTRSVPPLAIVEGNPARIIGYVETIGKAEVPALQDVPTQPGTQTTRVRGVTLHRFRMVPDLRGNLSVGEFEREVPFAPKRYFLVFEVPTAETRGEHAHLRCEQFLICVKGSVSIVADDGRAREEFILNQPYLGLYLPPMTWGIQYRYSSDAMLLVFASNYYDAADYVRDYEAFLKLSSRYAEGV